MLAAHASHGFSGEVQQGSLFGRDASLIDDVIQCGEESSESDSRMRNILLYYLSEDFVDNEYPLPYFQIFRKAVLQADVELTGLAFLVGISADIGLSVFHHVDINTIRCCCYRNSVSSI